MASGGGARTEDQPAARGRVQPVQGQGETRQWPSSQWEGEISLDYQSMGGFAWLIMILKDRGHVVVIVSPWKFELNL